MMSSLTQKEADLARAELTLQQLVNGELITALSQGGHSSSFQTPSEAEVRRNIEQLKGDIAALKGQGRSRGPIRMVL